jgi:rRNA-processing protein FCF1
MPSQQEQATAGPTQPTSLALLRQQIDEGREAVGRLLDHTQVVFDDINARADGFVVVGWMPHRWGPPKDGAQAHFGEARQTWQALYDLISQAVRRSAPERTQPLQSTDGLLRNIIEQSSTWQGAAGESVEQIRQRVDRSLKQLLALLEQLPAAHGAGGRVLVPDTNALLFKPDLETWHPPGGAWTVVLVPQVLRELDALKMRHGDLGEKAAAVIRRVKEYARRGDTFKGVKLGGALSLREVAVDPDMADTLPWLRGGHADDELLASVLELRCQDLNAVVALATRDRNLQNKARFARCLHLDVEDNV